MASFVKIGNNENFLNINSKKVSNCFIINFNIKSSD